MTPQNNEIAQLRHDVAALQNTLDALDTARPKPRAGALRRLIGSAAVLLAVSGLAFGALTAAGVEAFHIDEAGNIHIMGAVTIGGATTVQSLSTTGAISAATVSATGAVTGATVTSTGLLQAGDVSTGGEVAATTVTATTVTGTTVNATNFAGGALNANSANISGMVVDEGGNVRIPGNLDVNGLNDRIFYTNSVPNQTTFIPAGDVARLCGDGDGCEVRMAMSNYDGGNTAPASVVTWLYCDAYCKKWRTSAQLIDESVSGRRFGTDANQDVQHVLIGWDCYFTDGEYTNRAGTDNLVGFGLLKWIDQYPSSECSVVIID